MKLKKYLELSNQKLNRLENMYNFLPTENEINNIRLSADRACLRETIRIAKLRSHHKSSESAQKKLSEKRKEAILAKFIRPTAS